ncbi:MAG: zf-HC2 domain-containing protein [Gemmatimonadaceae bacterium]
MTDRPHLASEQVAAYLDNTLSEAECARVKVHLADCEACRKEIVSVSKLLEGAPRSRRRFVALSTMAAAAAAVVVIVLARQSSDSGLTAGTPVRGAVTPAASEGATTVRAIAPVGQQPTRGGIVFVWHAASPGATYRLTLTDDRGGKLWIGSTNDTTLGIPKRTVLLPGQSYHWYVDVLQTDAAAATSGITSFQVAR